MSRASRDPFQAVLRWYPARWRRANGAVLVDSLRDHAAHEHRSSPSLGDRLAAFTHGTALRLDARLSVSTASIAIVLASLAWVLLLSTGGTRPAFGWMLGVALAAAPLLTAVAVVALARVRHWISAPRSLLVLALLLPALGLAAITQLSWSIGFDLADAGRPLTGLAAAWGWLFTCAWIVGAAAIASFADGLFHRSRWRWFTRLPLAVLLGAVAAPVLGLSLVNPTSTTVIAAVVALMALRAIAAERVRETPASSAAARPHPHDARGTARGLAALAACFGAIGVTYALSGSSWSAGASDATVAMAQGITLLFAAAIPLLAAFVLIAPRRAGSAATIGPLALVALALVAGAIAYLSAPDWGGMTGWPGVSAALGGAAVAWWSMARLRGAHGLRIGVGVALGVGFAALFGPTVLPTLAFAVPVAAIVVLVRTFRRGSARNAASRPAGTDLAPGLRSASP